MLISVQFRTGFPNFLRQLFPDGEIGIMTDCLSDVLGSSPSRGAIYKNIKSSFWSSSMAEQQPVKLKGTLNKGRCGFESHLQSHFLKNDINKSHFENYFRSEISRLSVS